LSERTLDAAVRELYASGLSVEQQILVAEIVRLAAFEEAAAAQRKKERERKRVYRERVPGLSQDKRKEPKENNILNKPQGGSRGDLSQDNLENQFAEFWAAYPRKVAKGAARKAYRNALRRASHAEIMAGLKQYKPDPKFIAHPSSWLNADRWLDEAEKVVSFRPSGPKRTWAEIKAERENQTV
jgi:hypothetical protein